MVSKRLFHLFVLVLGFVSAFSQSQPGYVKTLGRPDKKGVALSGVTVRMKDSHNLVLSKQDGTFMLQMPGKKNGDAYSLQQVQKRGYELNELGVIGRQYAFSDRVPLTIVMLSTSQLQADKQRIVDNAYKVAEKNYNMKLDLLEKQKVKNIITVEQYRQQLQDLQDKFEKYQSLIDGLADHYAHVDYDNLDEKEREINLCIENADLERADSLLHMIFDPTDVLKRNKDALAKIEEQESRAREILAQANADMAAVLKQQEKDAEYLYHLYTIALARFDNDKAYKYIEARAALDTTNVDRQTDAGMFILDYIADNDKALAYFQLALRQSILNYQEESELAATSYNNIASVYCRMGEYQKALEYLDKALSICEKVFDQDNSLTARVYNNSGYAYCGLGDYKNGLESYTIGLNILEKIFGPEHPDIAQLYDNIGTVHDRQGDYSVAMDYFLKALAINEKTIGLEHPNTATLYNNIGTTYFQQGDYQKSLENNSIALNIFEKLYGVRHPNVANSYNNLGTIYAVQEDYPKALESLTKALNILEDMLGSEHPMVSNCYSNIAFIYSRQGNLDKAMDYYMKVLNISMNQYGSEHPDVADCYYNMGAVYNRQEKFHKALECYLKALNVYIKVLGTEHAHVFESYNNIGVIYSRLGNYSMGLEYFSKALVVAEKIYGTNHSETLSVKKEIEDVIFKKNNKELGK